MTHGYSNIIWYPEGVEGWTEADCHWSQRSLNSVDQAQGGNPRTGKPIQIVPMKAVA